MASCCSASRPTMRITPARFNCSSGCGRSVLAWAGVRESHQGRPPEGLQHDAVALGEPEERLQLLRGRVGVDLEGEPDLLEADGCLLAHPQGAAEVEVALGPH